MDLDQSGIHRAGLSLLYRIVPVLVSTSLYGKLPRSSPSRHNIILTDLMLGAYIAILRIATRGLR